MSLGRSGVSWAGLVSGPAAWAMSTQMNYILADMQCGMRVYPVPWVALGLALAALLGGFLSWQAWRTVPESSNPPRRAETERFVAGLGASMALLFAAVIVLQGLAGVLFSGCER